LPVLAFVLLAGCSDEPSGLRQARLSIEARDQTGRHAQIACEVLPLLQGSRRYVRHVIDDQLTLTVNAEPEQLSLSFTHEAGVLASKRTIPRGALLHGYAEEVTLRTDGATTYTIGLSSECPE
jgi:uncharacterized protein YqkB